jgi:hypothetical protein
MYMGTCQVSHLRRILKSNKLLKSTNLRICELRTVHLDKEGTKIQEGERGEDRRERMWKKREDKVQEDL